MSQTKIIVTIMLVILTLIAWISVITGNENNEQQQASSHVILAKEYISRGLYQKAIGEYEVALSLDSNESIWTEFIDVYKLWYEESEESYGDYLDVLKRAISYYDKNEDYYIRLAKVYIDNGDYKNAYNYLKKIKNKGINNQEIESLYMQAKYAYQLDWIQYTNYKALSQGNYAVASNGIWKYVDEKGNDVYNNSDLNNLSLAGSVGSDSVRVVSFGDRSQIIDADRVIQGFLNFLPVDAGIFAGGLVPISNGGVYSYYDLLGDMQFGNYFYAGTFCDGKAAVCSEAGWILIDNKGNQISSNVYEDIILGQEKEFMHSGVMLAKLNGKYQIYNQQEEPANAFSCDMFDIVTDDGLIAFCNGGKWGFVDIEGNIVIEPAYAGAKSFSNGYAAVSNGSTWGFIDKQGIMVIDYIFLNADYFNDSGYCMVQTDGDMWQLLSWYIDQ